MLKNYTRNILKIKKIDYSSNILTKLS